MEKITRQSLANGVSVRWKKQYPIDKDGIQKKLDNLGLVKNPDEIDGIIGNKSWTEVPDCSECGEYGKEFVVMVGEEPDCESNTAWLCNECIEKLQRLTVMGLEL